MWRQYVTINDGEELFGLPKSDYPNLHQVRKELRLLGLLYGLYNQVMKSVNGYYEIQWAEVDIEKITAELLEFQNR